MRWILILAALLLAVGACGEEGEGVVSSILEGGELPTTGAPGTEAPEETAPPETAPPETAPPADAGQEETDDSDDTLLILLLVVLVALLGVVIWIAASRRSGQAEQ
jgi:hypothetical protein